MLEIKVPMEVRDYQEKFLLGMGKRQLLSLGVTLAVSVPLGIYGRQFVSTDVIMWIILAVAAPCFCFGFIKLEEMYFEEFVKKWLQFNALPQKRSYVELNVFCELRDQVTLQEIERQKALLELDIKNRKPQKKPAKPRGFAPLVTAEADAPVAPGTPVAPDAPAAGNAEVFPGYNAAGEQKLLAAVLAGKPADIGGAGEDALYADGGGYPMSAPDTGGNYANHAESENILNKEALKI